MIWWSMGPRITMGLSPGEMRPMEMNFTPCAVSGSIMLPSRMLGWRVAPSMVGTLGP
jgi:hypothetical protein